MPGQLNLREHVRYIAGELVDVDGNPVVGVSSCTWAQFIDPEFDLTEAKYWHVSDRHSTRNATAEPGSLWRIVPTGGAGYKQQLVSGPIYCATLADAPDPTEYPGLQCFIASFAGDVISNGTVYDLCDEFVTLKRITDEVTKSSALTTAWYPIPVEIPRDVNGNSLFGVGCVLEFPNTWWSKTGATDGLEAFIRMGPTSSGGSDPLIFSPVTNTNPVRWARYLSLKRTGTDTVMWRGDGSSTWGSGVGAYTHYSNTTVHDFDANDTYINVGSKLTAATTDTALQIREYEVRLHRAPV